MYYTVGVLLWLSHPAALNLASAQLSKHNATAGRQHLHILIKLQIIASFFVFSLSWYPIVRIYFCQFVLTLSSRSF